MCAPVLVFLCVLIFVLGFKIQISDLIVKPAKVDANVALVMRSRALLCHAFFVRAMDVRDVSLRHVFV